MITDDHSFDKNCSICTTVMLLEAQMRAACKTGYLMRYTMLVRRDGSIINWPDPSKHAPPDLGCR